MTHEPRSLETIQRWMQTVVMHPFGPEEAIKTPEAQQLVPISADTVEQMIKPSKALTSLERLDIYNRAYYARLLDCLREEFSVLTRALGEDLFTSFALGYLQEHPSRSYTLGMLGAEFPAYLERTQPETSGDDSHDARWQKFIINLARLERAIHEVFDGPGVENEQLLDRDQLLAIVPADWPKARIECVPCLRLLSLSHPLNDYFTAMRQHDDTPVPEPKQSWLALCRRKFLVYRYDISAAQYALLSALQTGEMVGDAVQQSAEFFDTADLPKISNALQSWFREWTAAGFFRSVTTK